MPGLSEVWVDFAFSGLELGTWQAPFNTFGEGAAAVVPHGNLWIKGDSAQTAASETPRISKPMRVEPVNGAVQIGSPAAGFEAFRRLFQPGKP
jgi:hypothetical protein